MLKGPDPPLDQWDEDAIKDACGKARGHGTVESGIAPPDWVLDRAAPAAKNKGDAAEPGRTHWVVIGRGWGIEELATGLPAAGSGRG